MEGTDRRLGWIVIAVGALILGYVLGSGSNRQPTMVYLAPQGAQAMPGPGAQAIPGPGQPFAPGGDQQFGRGRGDRVGPGWQERGGPPFGRDFRDHHRPFYFLPFMFLGGLLKLGLLALLVFWIARRWRGGGGPPWARRWKEDRPTESEKRASGRPAGEAPEASEGADDSGYTGGTTKL